MLDGRYGPVPNIHAAEQGISSFFQYGAYQAGQLPYQVLTIAVDHNDHIGIHLARFTNASVQRNTLPFILGVPYHQRARGISYEGSVVGRAIVDDDDRQRELHHLQDHAADEAFFVIGWDDNHDAMHLQHSNHIRADVEGYFTIGYFCLSVHISLPDLILIVGFSPALRPSDSAAPISPSLVYPCFDYFMLRSALQLTGK